jgi:hypothetical protein
MAVYEELQIDQGSTFRYEITITNDLDDAPSDLTGFTIKSEIRKSYKSLAISGTFTTAFRSSNPLLGRIILSMTDEETAAIKSGRYLYDVIITSADGATYRIIEGIADVTPMVTQY